MINTTILGRLGADAEVKTTKEGKQFVSFRIATDDYVNNERVSTWVNITDFTERGVKMAQYLKKGSSVLVNGTLRVRTYQSTKDGSNQFSIDVMSDRTDFGGSSSGKTESASEAVSVAQTQSVASIADCGTLTPPPTPITTSASCDDLPF